MRNVFMGMVFGVLLAIPLTGLTANSDTYRQLDLFGDVFERVHTDYVTEVEDKELIEAAINGMLASLDPHSSYLSPNRFNDMQEQTRGEFGGLGIEVTMEEGLVKVVAPIDDTPAAKAGIQAGDLISHLDDDPIQGLTLDQAVEKMRGGVNTKLRLTVLREGVDQPLKFTITRAIIKVESVRSRIEGENKDIAYVRITTFNEQTKNGLEKAMKNLKRDLGDDMIGVILDLRNNPGGLLDQAIIVSDAFLDKGQIVSTRGRHSRDSQRFDSRPGDLAEGKPVIVMINGGSASASEIVAGALQDHKRAVILGTKSFGKGSVQVIIPLNGGSDGALKLTNARYFTPSGRSIQAKGIEPDIEVHQFTPEGEQMIKLPSEADLRNHLEGDEAEDQTDDGNAVSETVTEEVPSEILELDRPLDEEVEDYQLSRAMQILQDMAANSTVVQDTTSTQAN